MASHQSQVQPVPSHLVVGPIDVGDLMLKIQSILNFAIDYCEGNGNGDQMDLSVVWDTPGFKKNVCIKWYHQVLLCDDRPEAKEIFRLWLLGRLKVLRDNYLHPDFKIDFVMHSGLEGADVTISTYE